MVTPELLAQTTGRMELPSAEWEEQVAVRGGWMRASGFRVWANTVYAVLSDSHDEVLRT